MFRCLWIGLNHPTAEMIWRSAKKELPYLALDSVYRILDEFVEVGVLRRLEGHRVLRYDMNVTEHDHFVCSHCGKMFDFKCENAPRLPPECGEFGTVTSVEVQVRGMCRECQEKDGKETA